MGDTLPFRADRKRGRVERGLADTLRHAREQNLIDGEADAALVALARSLARSVDSCAANSDHFKLTRAAAELRATLAALRLGPAARAVGEEDALNDFLASLTAPDVRDA